MADLSQLETALRNADAAGDVEAARMLAQAIQTQRQAAPERLPVQAFMQNLAAGGLRGAGSIGATLLTPFDMLMGNTKSIGNPERRQAMDQALQGLGVNTDSLAYGAGKLGGEIAGTAGVGGVAANALGRLPMAGQAAPLLDAVRNAGMTAGGLTGAAGLGVRTAGGAVTGGLAGGLTNPEDAGLGALIGGVAPGLLQGAVRGGRAVAAPFRSSERKAAESLVNALELPAHGIAAWVRAARELVPGSKPTVAQALGTPQASTLERIVSETPGGAALKERYAAQNAARLAAIDNVAPVDPRGFRSAQQDFGEAALSAIRGGDAAARAKTRAAYQAIPQDEAALYLPDLAAVRDEFFPRGAFGGRQAADQAVDTARSIGLLNVPADVPVRGGKAPETLAQAVRKAGGISIVDNGGLRGEVKGVQGDFKNMIRKNGGISPDRMAEQMYEAGFIKSESADDLFEALRSEATGSPVFATYADPSKGWAAARDAGMGPPQGDRMLPQKVTLGEFDALRKSIGNSQRAAFRDPERATEAAALARMKAAMGERIDEVVRGDGAIDEALPIDWANQLTEAQRLKRAQVEQFRTGPQAAAFKTGPDGLPSVQGGEFAPKVWGQRPGVAEDIKVFRKVLDEQPELLGKFRSMITTEGAATATNGGQVTGRFVRWVENSLPGLKESFSPAEVKALERIAQDIRRAEQVAAAGAARGSPTYQNAAGAMSAGLLDSPLINMAANRVPILNQFAGPLLESLRGSATKTKAQNLAGLLTADDVSQLQGLLKPSRQIPLPIQRGLLMAAPVVPAD